ncbi:TatD family deoxyribonuclease [Corticibacter populi]|uniref:TatD family deoxyribonuclease n=1 Tax=Corticibacter populi TaxID=1550736 RepID=A0A3M6QU38_9BURK|nr:TatD family hydrolase [Corticibacter populi]RMX06391.1 TatD family deoxyribonuclease [Corticibacter populi]RZS32063.1 TatD DNase family protein [Corticibacter populi]
MPWIDTHCHLDAAEFDADRAAVRDAARAAGVACCVIPAVAANSFEAAAQTAHAFGDAYALGIHPLYTPAARDDDLQTLQQQLAARQGDARLVAVGEIGLDYFEPLDNPRQERFLREQLRLAKAQRLPVILHVRRSVDKVLKYLREAHFDGGGIAHAFNGSRQQAQAFLDLGFKLGFGGAVTYDRALQLRRLAAELPADAIVLETDAPDIPPHWLYVAAHARAQGLPQGRNSPAELPRIARTVAGLRGADTEEWMQQTARNALQALPRLAALFATP